MASPSHYDGAALSDHRADLPRFEQYGPGYLGWERYEVLAPLREHEPPLALDELDNLWVFRYEDAWRALVDTEAFGAAGSEIAVALGQDSGPLWDFMEYQLITANPPDHTRIRRAAGYFSRHLVRDLEPIIRESCDRLIDGFPDEGTIEFSYEFAFKLPVGVIMRMLNLPAEDEELIRDWSPKALPADPSPETIAACNEAIRRLREYIEAVIAERRVKPIENDIVSELAATQARGELSEDELWALVVSFIIAGHETTTSALSLGLHTLLENRDQLELLRNDRSLLPNAAEEILRYETPVEGLVRIAKRDLDFHGVEVPHGSTVQISTAAADRDPRRFPEPDRFDVTRENASQHLAFSAGVHRCIGAPLAQLEIPIALGALLDRLRTIEPAGQATLQHHVFRGFSELPLYVERAA
jgi:cytochrome P450